MDLNRLKYSKSDSSKTINLEPLPKPNSTSTDEIGGLGALATDYTKGEPHLETTVVFILSGGSVREKDYFKPIKDDKQITNIKIAFRSKKGQGLKPYELIAIANDYLKSKIFITEDNLSYHIEDGDIIYLIQDVDEFGTEIKKHLASDYERSAIQWIISNPSFEIWLFYHHFDDPAMLSEGLSKSEHDRSNWLKEYLHGIIPGGIKPMQALHSADVAINNSRKNYSEVDGFPNIYATQMHIVAERILEILGEETYNEMNRRRQNRIALFKAQNLSRK